MVITEQVTENLAVSTPLSLYIFWEDITALDEMENTKSATAQKSRQKTKKPREENISIGRIWNSQLHYQILFRNLL